MRRIFQAGVIAVSLGAAYLLFWPAPIDPVVFTPPPNPGTNAVYARNDHLKAARLTPELGLGPEDVTRGPDGLLYTGFQDGRIMRFREDGTGAELFANTGGRPLGMRFDAQGNLIVADAFRGLLSIGPGRKISVLTDRARGERFLFTNDLDIAADGTIWFSDSSRRFDQRHYMLDFLETRATGRLLSYDPKTGETTVRQDGLMFPNGVALGPDDKYVLVNETMAARIRRYWISGPKAGECEVLLTLPAHPDNLSYNQHGLFWVALVAPRQKGLEWMWGGRILRKVVSKLPQGVLAAVPSPGWVIAIDTDGRVVRNYQNWQGAYSPVTSVHEFGGNLYLGSIRERAVGRFKLP